MPYYTHPTTGRKISLSIRKEPYTPRYKRPFVYRQISIRFGAHIYDLRRQHRMTQKDLASRLRLSQSYIAKIENGGNVDLETMIKLACLFGKKIDVIFYE